jgi:hypothetical protein
MHSPRSTSPLFQPCRTVPNHPAHESLLKTNIFVSLLAFNPLVAENLIALRRELGHKLRAGQEVELAIAIVAHSA